MSTKAAPGRTPHAPAKHASCPNIPSFDYDTKTGKPNLLPGEKIIEETKVHGIPLFITDGGRKIYISTIEQYEDKIAPLAKRLLWYRWFPHAAPKHAIQATAEAVGKLDERLAALELGAKQTSERNRELESENEALRREIENHKLAQRAAATAKTENPAKSGK